MDVDPVDGYAELADVAEALADRTSSSFARLLGYHVAGTQAFQEGRIADATRLLEAAIDAAGFSDSCTLSGFVPNVYLPAMAGIVAQLRGDDDAARTHVVDRHPAWFRARGRVDPTASIDIGFTIALVAALRADPIATRKALVDVDFVGAPFWAAHLANGCSVLEGWAATMLGDREGPGRALAALDRLDRGVATRMIRPAFRTFAGEALLHVDDASARDVRPHALGLRSFDCHARRCSDDCNAQGSRDDTPIAPSATACGRVERSCKCCNSRAHTGFSNSASVTPW